MLRFRTLFKAGALGFALSATALPSIAIAQTTKDALRAEQTTLFDAMSGDSQNLDLMFRYAGISARLQDYEAAISTLERMLVFDSNLPRVRLELGALYFNIGSYVIAERYFREVAKAEDLPEPVRARIARFRNEIVSRTRKHRFNGRLEVGLVHDSNAGLGPTDRDAILFGRPATRIGDLDESDTGVKIIAQVTHRYDFGGQANEHWRTDASFFGRRYQNVDQGASESFFLRTGPQLALDDTTFGPKIRPFVDATHVRVDDRRLYNEGGVGAEYVEVFSDKLSAFGSVRAAIRTHTDERANENGALFDMTAGLAWTPVRDFVITGALGAGSDRAKADFESNSEVSLRLAASYDYDPGLEIADGKWRLSGYASAAFRAYDAPNPVVTARETRKDTDLRVGVRNVFTFRKGFYAALDASVLDRSSTISNFELDNVGVSAALGYKF